MNIDVAFPSKYLKASDFEEGPRDVVIVRVIVEPVGKERLMKPILYFEGEEKGLVLNKTNASKLTSILGSKDTTHWTGKTVTCFSATVEFGGDMIDAIRIRASTANVSF
jgi:hypothetical protein